MKWLAGWMVLLLCGCAIERRQDFRGTIVYGGEGRVGNYRTSKQLSGEAADGQRYVGFGLPNFDFFLFYDAAAWRHIGSGFTSNSSVNAWAVTASTGEVGGDGFGQFGLAEREKFPNATRLEGSFRVRHTNSIRPRMDVNLRDAKGGGVALQGTFAEHSDWSFRPQDFVLVPMIIFGWWPVPQVPIYKGTWEGHAERVTMYSRAGEAVDVIAFRIENQFRPKGSALKNRRRVAGRPLDDVRGWTPVLVNKQYEAFDPGRLEGRKLRVKGMILSRTPREPKTQAELSWRAAAREGLPDHGVLKTRKHDMRELRPAAPVDH